MSDNATHFCPDNIVTRAVEVFTSGRQAWLISGEETMRYFRAIQEAAKIINDQRKADAEAAGKKGTAFVPVSVIMHDRWCGLHRLATTKKDDNTNDVAKALQMAMWSKEEWEAAGAKPPFDPMHDLIVVMKSFDTELTSQCRTATLLRDILQANIGSKLYLEDLAVAKGQDEPDHRGARLLVMISPSGSLADDKGHNPVPELKPEIMPLPDYDTLNNVVRELFEPIWERYKETKGKRGLPETPKPILDKIIDALTGLTIADAEESLSLALVRLRKKSEAAEGEETTQWFDLSVPKTQDFFLDTIEKEKAKVIAQIPGLTYIPKEQTICATPPGYEKIEAFIRERQALPDEACRKFNFKRVRGITIGGIPGTAKTEVAKFICRLLGRIGLLWEQGASKGSHVGETEKNTRQVIQLARTLKAVVVCDDVDKGSMAKSKDYSGDGGTSGNMIQMLLTEMSDAYSDAVYIFTFNRVPDLPELLRKGRIDRLYKVAKPDAPTRKAIILNHVNRWGMEVDKPEMLDLLAGDLTEGQVGAELAHGVVKEAAIRALAENTNTISAAYMCELAKGIIPMTKQKRWMEDLANIEDQCSQFEEIGNVPGTTSVAITETNPRAMKGRRAVSM